MLERRTPARRLAAPAGGPRQAAQAARRRDVRRAQAGLGQEHDRHHDGARPAAQGLDEGPGDRPADRADRARRVPHVRHGLDVPERQGLQPGRPAVRVGRPQAAAGLQGVRAGPDAPRGHLRGRRDGVGDGRRVGVLHARRAHDPVLHLLLDVRVPADRRLDLGDGRPAGARLPDRRHRRPHHADRRGPPARRRPLAAARGDQPGGRALRPGVRLRGQPHHAGRPAADVRRRATSTRTARTSSSTSPSTTSRSCQPKEPEDLDVEGILKGIYQRRRRAGDGDGARGCSCSPPASASRGSTRRSGCCAEDWGVAADTWSVTSWNELARDAVAAEEWNLLHPGEDAADAVRHRQARRTSTGPVVAVSRLHARRTAADRALGARRLPRARRRRLRLRRHPAGRPALLPRRRRSRSSCRRCRRSPTRGEVEPRGGRARRSTSTASTTPPPSPTSSRRAATPSVAPRSARRREVPGRGSRRRHRRRVRQAGLIRVDGRRPCCDRRRAGSQQRRGTGRGEYVAGWVDRTKSLTIFTNRCGWSLCGKWPALGITSTVAPGRQLPPRCSAWLTGITRSSLPQITPSASPGSGRRGRPCDDLAAPVDDGA